MSDHDDPSPPRDALPQAPDPTPPEDSDPPWWHPSAPREPQGGAQPSLASAPPRQTPLQRVTLALAVIAAFALTFGAVTYLFPRRPASVSDPIQPRLPASAPSAPTRQPTDPDQQRADPALGVTAVESAGVVLIEADTEDGISSGSGIVVSQDGKVLTNYHVLAGSTQVTVTIADTAEAFGATMLGFDPAHDIALLQLTEAENLVTVVLDDDKVQPGDPVYAVGNANGDGRLMRASGQVTDIDQNLTVTSDSPWGSEEDLKGLIETTAGAVPGHSGGPMFDIEGEVLGVTTAGSEEHEKSYAVPIAQATAVVDTIEAGRDDGTVRVGPTGYLGVTIGQTNSVGATVTRVDAGSPAETAGIVAGCLITKIGDTAITKSVNPATVIRALEPGDHVEVFWVAPSGTRQQAAVTLGSATIN